MFANNRQHGYQGQGYMNHSRSEAEEVYDEQQYHGGCEQEDNPEDGYFDQTEDFEDPNQDQYEEYYGRHRQTENEDSWFEDANGFDLDGGQFSAVGGSVYYGDEYLTRGDEDERPPPRPHNPRSTSFFRGASGFRITDGQFMSVGGNMYGLPSPPPPQRNAAPPPSRMRSGRGAYRGSAPRGRPPTSPRPSNDSNGMYGHGRGSSAQYGPSEHRNDQGRQQSRGGYGQRGRPTPPHHASGRERVVGETRGRPPVQNFHQAPPHDQEDYTPGIQVVSPPQSPQEHTTATSTEHDPGANIYTTRTHSVEAQIGRLSISASSQRSSTLHTSHYEATADRVPSNARTPSLRDPVDAYPSPSSLNFNRRSLDTIHDTYASSTGAFDQEHHPSEPPRETTPTDDPRMPADSVKKPKTKRFTGFLHFKGKKPENK